MAGYWPSVFCMFMDQGRDEVHKLAKKNDANIQPSWLNKLSWSIKDLLYGFWGNFLAAPSESTSKIAPSCLLAEPITA